MQGELVGHVWETDILVTFMSLFGDISKSASSYLRIIFPDTLYYFASDGESLRSLASLQLEFLMRGGRHVGTHFGRNPESHDFHDF